MLYSVHELLRTSSPMSLTLHCVFVRYKYSYLLTSPYRLFSINVAPSIQLRGLGIIHPSFPILLPLWPTR